MCEEFDDGDEEGVDGVGDDQGRDERCEGLSQQELLAANGRGVVRTGSRVPCWRSPTTE
jgi:hypothetical protein